MKKQLVIVNGVLMTREDAWNYDKK